MLAFLQEYMPNQTLKKESEGKEPISITVNQEMNKNIFQKSEKY